MSSNPSNPITYGGARSNWLADAARAIFKANLRSIPPALASMRQRFSAMEPRRRKRTLAIAGGVAFLLLAGGVYLALPRFQPDYEHDGLDDIFDYTLLSDEFNNQPVEERLKLIAQLVKRLQSMDGGDSMLMASFAAGIAGTARAQIEQNVSRLGIDLWDKHAKGYPGVKPEDREQYLEAAFVDFAKTMEAVGGSVRDISDADRINEVRKQAERDRAALRDPNNQPPGEALGRVFEFMNNNVGSHATPEQRTRGLQMMRDMTRMFRGQDIATGKPLGPG